MQHFLIVGLGNPGDAYENTRHNIGFVVVDEIAKYFEFPSFSNKFSSLVTSKIINQKKITLMKPLTFMNLSGNAVAQAIHFYKIAKDDLFIIHDDLDLNLAQIKVKFAGGSGGHNGIKSIDQHIGLDYYRVRVGIGKPLYKNDVTNFVLAKFSAQENKELEKVIRSFIDHFEYLILKNLSMLMNKISMELQKNGI